MAHGLLAAPPVSSLASTEVGSTGPTVVFLHGLFGQGKNWTSIAKALLPTARSLLVDLPNHGRSGWTDQFSYAEMAAMVADHLDQRSAAAAEPVRYAVVGHSMGGKVAMVLALLRPNLVERLCVVDVSPVRTGSLSSFAPYVRGMRSVDLGRLTDRAEADRALTDDVPDPTIRGFLLQNLRRDPSGPTPWRWQMNLDLLGRHLADLGDWPDLGTDPYAGPVMWLAGAHSAYVQPEFVPAMRALFPRVQLVRVKGAGHWVHSDQPVVFAAALRQFLHLPAPSPGKVEP